MTASRARLRSAAKGLLLSATGVLLLWAFAWIAVPPLAKRLIEAQASAALGRVVTLGGVDFSPWSLTLDVRDLAMAASSAAQPGPPQLAIARIHVNASLASLFRLAPVIDAAEIEGVAIRLRHLGSGSYDIDDIIQRLTRPADTPPSGPVVFAVHNLVVSGGSVDFRDEAHAKDHTVRNFSLKLPFLSNLDAQREIVVQPHLSFRLNGSAFDSSAEGTPFAQTRQGEFRVKLDALNLAPWLPYIRPLLPLDLDAATLSADLALNFQQSPKTSLRVSGWVQADKVSLGQGGAPDGQAPGSAREVLSFERLKVDLADVRPLERQVQLSAVTLTSPVVVLARDAAGRLNIESLTSPTPAASVTAGDSEPPRAWTVEVQKVALQAGEIRWQDLSTRAETRLRLQDLQIEAADLKFPFSKPVSFTAQGRLGGGKPGADTQGKLASLSFQGTTTDRAATVQARVSDMPLAMLGTYVSQVLEPSLEGQLDADFGLDWQAGAGDTAKGRLNLSIKDITLQALALKRGSTSLASLQKIQIARADVDVPGRTVSVDSLTLARPLADLARDSAGRWMFSSWLQPVPERSGAEAAGPPAAPWALAVRSLAIDDGAVNLLDDLPATPVRLQVKGISLKMQDIATAGQGPVKSQGALQVQAGRNEPGRLVWRGQGTLSPMAVTADLEATRLPVHALQPYGADLLKVDLLRSDASFKGQLSLAQAAAGLRTQLRGDLAVEDLQANAHPHGTLASSDRTGAALRLGDELLRWKVLSLRGLDLDLAPGAAARIDVRETVLSDFYARLVLDEAGRLNLQNVMKVEGQSQTESPAPSAVAPAAPALVRLGPVSVTGGQVDFSDRFIKPNYAAQLSDLTGRLGAFSSQPQPGEPELADLSLRGRVQGTATLDIEGQVNPLVRPLALNLKARVRELELSPLSAYSVRHAGHGIERGKLSVDLAYLVRPDGRLEASNRIILNQLTFGDKVENAPASLPVRLAVALLADRQGVIDIDLPVSGSINEPGFSLAPLIFKVIGNLLVKAVTAPFSLLASALGGGDELSTVNFAPGSAELSAQAGAGLDKVVGALVQRPALQMTVVGTASLAVERDGLLRESLKGLLLAERRRAAALAGAAVQPTQDAELRPDEYPGLLTAVYRRADIPKPRTTGGALQELPLTTMENLLLSHLDANEESVRQLATRRGVAVRDYLAARQVPLARLFLGTALVVDADDTWTPRAQLSLKTP